jgi:hypothetical protein
MFIPDPDFYPSRIPDRGSRIQKQQQKRGVKKLVVIPFILFHKIENYFIFEMLKKKIGPIFKELENFLPEKNCH